MIGDALQDSQESDACVDIASKLWPALPAAEMIRLDQCDRGLLRRTRSAVSGQLAPHLEQRLYDAAVVRATLSLPGNRHASGKRLRDIVRAERSFGAGIDRAVDKAFQSRDSDDLGSATFLL